MATDNLSKDIIDNLVRIFPARVINGGWRETWRQFRDLWCEGLSDYHAKKAISGQLVKTSIIEEVEQAYSLMLARAGHDHTSISKTPLLTYEDFGRAMIKSLSDSDHFFSHAKALTEDLMESRKILQILHREN